MKYATQYPIEQTMLILGQIDAEISDKIKKLHAPKKYKKNIGFSFVETRIKELKLWKAHYLENTLAV